MAVPPATEPSTRPDDPSQRPDRTGLAANASLPEDHDGRHARTLIWLLAAGIAAFVYWSSVTPVYEVVSGSGTVKPEGLSTRVEHLEGGIVARIDVADGALVAAGAPILTLASTRLRSDLAQTELLLDQLAASIARFEAIAELRASEVDRSRLDGLGSDAILSEFDFRLSQIETLRAEQRVSHAQQRALRSHIESLRKERTIQRAQLFRYRHAGSSGSVSINRREEVERETLRLDSRISQLEGEVSVHDAKIAQLKVRESALIAEFRHDAILKLDEARTEHARLSETRAALVQQIDRSIVTSPVAGVVNALAVQNLGEVIQPGEVIAEIIPSGGATFAEVEIPADRIGGVTIGSPASVKVLTYDFTRYGDFPAEVEAISPSSFAKENGETVFRVRLGFVANEGQAVRRASPGMTLTADIRSDARSVLSYLLKPIRVIADRALTEA